MRNAMDLVKGDAQIITGEFQRTAARAEVAEWGRDLARLVLKHVLDAAAPCGFEGLPVHILVIDDALMKKITEAVG